MHHSNLAAATLPLHACKRRPEKRAPKLQPFPLWLLPLLPAPAPLVPAAAANAPAAI